MAFDYEYIAEDGKQIFMREGEVLMLINKTNHDWWQVREKEWRPVFNPTENAPRLVLEKSN